LTESNEVAWAAIFSYARARVHPGSEVVAMFGDGVWRFEIALELKELDRFSDWMGGAPLCRAVGWLERSG
jgi:hypothetical protein